MPTGDRTVWFDEHLDRDARLVGRRRGRRADARRPAAPGSARGVARRPGPPGPGARRAAVATAGWPGASRSTRRSPPRPSSTRPPPRPAARSRPSTSARTSGYSWDGDLPPLRDQVAAGSTPGSPSSSCARRTRPTSGVPSCAVSPTTCWTCRRDDRGRAGGARRPRPGGVRQPALAWGVVLDGRLAMPGGNGATSTVFRIASMTKSFTAATVLAPARRRRAAARRRDRRCWPGSRADRRLAAGHDPPRAVDGSGLPEDDPWADRHLDMDRGRARPPRRRGLAFAFPTGTAVRVLEPRVRAARRPRPTNDGAAARAARHAPHDVDQPDTTTGRPRRPTARSATGRSPGWAGCGRASRTWRRGCLARRRLPGPRRPRRRPAATGVAPRDAAGPRAGDRRRRLRLRAQVAPRRRGSGRSSVTRAACPGTARTCAGSPGGASV